MICVKSFYHWYDFGDNKVKCMHSDSFVFDHKKIKIISAAYTQHKEVAYYFTPKLVIPTDKSCLFSVPRVAYSYKQFG